MKKTIFILILISLIFSLGLTSCKKTHVPPPDEDSLSIPQELIDEWTAQYNLTEDDYILKAYVGDFHEEFLAKKTIGAMIRDSALKYEPQYKIVYSYYEYPQNGQNYIGILNQNVVKNCLKNGKTALKKIGVDAEIEKVYYLIEPDNIRSYIYYVTDKGDYVFYASIKDKEYFKGYVVPIECFWDVAEAMEERRNKLLASGKIWDGGDGRTLSDEAVEKLGLEQYRIGSLIE